MIRVLRDLLAGAKPQRKRQFFHLTLLTVVGGLVELASLGFIALFITSLTSPHEVMHSRYLVFTQRWLPVDILTDIRTFYLALGSGTVLLVLVKNGLAVVQTYCVARFDGAINVDHGCLLLRGFLALPYSWVSGKNSADLLSLLGWRLYVGNFFTHAMTLLSEGVITLLLLSTLTLLHPFTTVAVIGVLGGIGGGCFLLVRSRIYTVGSRIRELVLLINKVSMKSLQGVKDVKLFNRAEDSVGYFEEVQTAFIRKLAVQRVLERLTVWVLETVGIGGLVLGALAMVLTVGASSAEMMGALSLLAVSAWRVLPALYRVVATVGMIQGYFPFLERVCEMETRILEHEQEQRERGQVALPPLEREIRFEGVAYTYPGAESPALQGVDLVIPYGQFLGVVGHSGAGKSTMVDILTGLLPPDNGRVLVDGRALDPDSVSSWRSQLGFVPQSPYLFDGTLAQNVAFTVDDRKIDRDRVAESCVQAGLGDLLAGLPRGVDSVIGERGGQLSGGQAQRVAIARALYHGPAVLVFDEATSSLDNTTEQRIRQTIAGLRGDRTVVVIAHRLDTVRDCDAIVWLEHGRVVAHGSPESVLPRYEDQTQKHESTR